MKPNELYIIIQARVGSTRLPNKILLPFYNNDSILTLMVDKLTKLGVNIVVATSDDSRNNIIEQEMQKVGVRCFRGSEDNVLNRFIEAAKQVNAKYLIRVCSDNPFLDYNSMKQLVDVVLEVGECHDYIGFRVNDTPSIKTHFGLWAEFVSLAALEKVANLTQDKLYIEHVTNYVYSHPYIFNIKWLSVSSTLEDRQNIRLTIDTEADFKNAQKVYSAMQQSFVNYTIENLIAYIDNDPELCHLMEEQILSNSK